MKNCKRFIDRILILMFALFVFTTGVSAMITDVVTVPNWGGWTAASDYDTKANASANGIMHKYSTALLPVYGDFVQPYSTTRISQNAYIIPNTDNLSYFVYANLYYKEGYYYTGRIVSSRLKSSNIEPSTISTIYSFSSDSTW
ncbi:MAG TPA: hypothetical protein DEO50_11210 [Erysipelotrichaceae bacterium]|nr:MAG: hypothetical protein A2Y19_05530 [Firmicutes bacterium GWE2_51_13]HBZ42422.1 hypothetical protein [Erysipelotrichaceae bacterium]